MLNRLSHPGAPPPSVFIDEVQSCSGMNLELSIMHAHMHMHTHTQTHAVLLQAWRLSPTHRTMQASLQPSEGPRGISEGGRRQRASHSHLAEEKPFSLLVPPKDGQLPLWPVPGCLKYPCGPLLCPHLGKEHCRDTWGESAS